MVQIGTLLLANVFSALLPPIDPREEGFYEVLGLEKGATNEEIRKAYKKASLKYHPDKVAQRREDPAAAAAQYEKVQEAYGVLINDEKRQRYHALSQSPTRYRFVSQGTLSNPTALFENLHGASFFDKTRLVVLCSIIVLVILLQPILVAAKVNHVVEQDGALEDTLWVVLLLPFWVIGFCYCAFWLVLVVLVPQNSRIHILIGAVEQVMWYWAIMRMARKWDGSIDARYASVLLPVYIAMSLQWIQSFMLLQKIRLDVRRMVSLDYLEKEVLKGKSLEDLTEEEQQKLQNKYMVVTVPPDFEPILDEPEEGQENVTTELDEKDIEEQKVEASPEFEAATEIYNSTFGNLVGSLLFGSLFLMTLTLKLDAKIKASWWVVFIPIWIYWGSKWLFYFYSCACASISGEEIILHLNEEEEDEDGEEKDGDEEEGGEGGSNKDTGTKKAKLYDDDEDDMRPMDSGFVDANTSLSEFNKASSKDESTAGSKGSESKSAATHSKSGTTKSSSSKKPPSFKIINPDGSVSSGEIAEEEAQSNGQSSKAESSKRDDAESTKDSSQKSSGKWSKSESKKAESLRSIGKSSKAESKKDGSDSKSEKEGGDDDEDDDENIRVDEETFRAWQNAYEEAERGAMEKQAKASMECITLTIKLALILMVVAKIEKNYDNDDPDDVGFNTFWLLFPFFVFFGVVCCCCTCLIYGLCGDPNELYGEQDEEEEGEDQNDEESPAAADPAVIPMPPPPTETAEVGTTAGMSAITDPSGATESAPSKAETQDNSGQAEGSVDNGTTEDPSTMEDLD